MKIISNIALMAAICGFPIAALSQAQDPQILQAIESLKNKVGKSFTITWNDQQTRIKALDGNLSFPKSKKNAFTSMSPDQVAFDFLKQNYAIFKMKSSGADLRRKFTKESLSGYHIMMEQTYRGLPVFNGGIEVHLSNDSNKAINLIHNYYLPDIDISTIPVLSNHEIKDLVKFDVFQHYMTTEDITGRQEPIFSKSALTLKEEPKLELGVFNVKEKPVLVYKVLLEIESPKKLLEYIVDANTGEVIESVNLIQNFQGQGKVFNPNPVNTLNNRTLTASSIIPDVAYITTNLLDIKFNTLFKRYVLFGPYVNVSDLEELPHIFDSAPIPGRIAPLTTSFLFINDRKFDSFEHVMVYSVIDRNQRYIQSLGFKGPIKEINSRSIEADPHGLNNTNNSHYVPNVTGTGYLAFGKTPRNIDHAEDADVILHEYGHAIQDNITKGKYLRGAEARAMGEGFGDYWAASNTRIQSTISGFDQGECFAEWLARGFIAPKSCLRKVNGNKHYPENMSNPPEEHDDGEIWSAVLWDILNRLSKPVADKIILESHFLVPANPKFSDGGEALLKADKALYAGKHRNALCTALTERGIGATGCGIQIILTWNKLGVDLDLHLRGPDGFSFVGPRFDNDCAYYNKSPDWGTAADTSDNPRLFQDCTTDCKQEEITFYKVTQPGTYKVLVHNFSDHGLGPATAKVQVFAGRAIVFQGTSVLNSTDAVWIPYRFSKTQ